MLYARPCQYSRRYARPCCRMIKGLYREDKEFSSCSVSIWFYARSSDGIFSEIFERCSETPDIGFVSLLHGEVLNPTEGACGICLSLSSEIYQIGGDCSIQDIFSSSCLEDKEFLSWYVGCIFIFIDLSWVRGVASGLLAVCLCLPRWLPARTRIKSGNPSMRYESIS